MTASSQSFIDHIIDSLTSINKITNGRFFGGTGLKADGVQFAMLMGDSLFFVVDDTTRPKYEAAGMECFWYNTKKKRVDVRKYYEVPGELLDDPETLTVWAKESIKIAKILKK